MGLATADKRTARVGLMRIATVDLPSGGDYDHADVHLRSGRVYLANTALDQGEVLDGPGARHLGSIVGCAGASGVLAIGEAIVAAARGSGEVLVLDGASAQPLRRITVGPAPNGLAWDPDQARLLVADTSEHTARLVDLAGSATATIALPGRPRWAVHDARTGHFYVNVKDPAGVIALDSADLATLDWLPLAAIGPHGLGIDAERGVLLVACDDASLRFLDPSSGHELHALALAGEPDVVFVDARRASAYVCVGDPPTLHVVDLDERTAREAISTGAGAKTAALDAERGRLYVFVPTEGQAWVYQL